VISITFATASGLGPVIGGAITQGLGWRVTFFVTPIAALAGIAATWLYFPSIKPIHKTTPRLDWPGATLLAIGIGAPLAGLALLNAKSHTSLNLWGLGVILIGIISLYLLVPIERKATTPIFPLRVLRTKEARNLNLAGLLSGGVMFVLIFYIPLLLQDSFDFSPTRAGLLMTPLVAGTSVGSIINGRLFSKQNEPARLMVFGSMLLSIGCLLTLTFSAASRDWWILLSMTFCGVGLGFLLPNFTLFMQMLAEQRDVGVASALVQTTRALGSAFGTALVGVIIAYVPISLGIKIGLALCVVASFLIAFVCSRIHMKNFSTT